MSYNWSIVTDKLYGILKGSCKSLSMYDAKGNETIDPDKATRFFATFSSHNPNLDDFSILVAIHDQGQTSFINIKTPKLANDADFKHVHQIRNHIRKAIGQKEGIKVSWQVFDKDIDPREEAVNNIKESKDVSKWFGTTKSSFQRIGEAKLIIRHSDSINEEKLGARTRHIRALFVENKLGERFSYPHLHMAGARAFARHISNGGTNHDAIAESILTLSSDYMSLRRAAHTMRQNQIISEWIVAVRESMDGINQRLKKLHGPKGYQNAESILSSKPMVLDENATNSTWQKLAEGCSCGQDDPGYNDLGVAAKYLGSINNQSGPVTFSWTRKPNMDAMPADNEMLEQLHWQISELADACADERASARLAEVASMIAANIKPTQEDIELVREAIASSMTYTEDQHILPEEAELDNFLNEFAPEAIFSESDQVSQFIVGDKVKHKTQQLGVGTVVANPEGDEYPVKFGNDPEIYYTPAEDLDLVETVGKADTNNSAESLAEADYDDNADITENYDRLKTLKKMIADIERKEKQLPPGISAERKKLAIAKEKLAKEHNRLFHSQFGNRSHDDGNSLAEEDHDEPTKDDIIWCSNCGKRFHGNGRKHGFSHCENHKGFKMIYETLVTDDENVNEGDAYGVAQKDRERKEEIAYNKEQRAKRWNFGEPVKDDTAADSDLEEDADIRFIPSMPGEAIAQHGAYYLMFNPERYDSHTVKNEYEVYKKVGEKYEYVEDLNMPYQRPGEAIQVFNSKYGSQNETGATLDENSVELYPMTYTKTQKDANAPYGLVYLRKFANIDFHGEKPYTPERVRYLVKNSPEHKKLKDEGYRIEKYGEHDTRPTYYMHPVIDVSDDTDDESKLLERIKNLAGL